MCHETEKGPQQTDVTELKAHLLSETLEVFCYVCTWALLQTSTQAFIFEFYSL